MKPTERHMKLEELCNREDPSAKYKVPLLRSL